MTAKPGRHTGPADAHTRPIWNAREIVYDCEILRAIPDKHPRVDGLAYCAGWKDFAGMGIACICAIEVGIGLPRIFLQDNLAAFGEWTRGALLIGFNNVSFDNELLRANHLYAAAGSYDILRALRLAVGETAGYTPGLTRGGRTLRDCARANLDGVVKLDDGANAPILAQHGKYGELVDYCLRDVMIERRLFLRRAAFIDPVLKVPVRLEGLHPAERSLERDRVASKREDLIDAIREAL